MLILSKVQKTVGGRYVLDSVDVAIPIGGHVAVIGPSGGGKTTLLRLIAGLERPDVGELRFKDRIFVNEHLWTPPWKRRVGMVFQDLALWPHMTVREHLAFVLSKTAHQRSRKSRADRSEALLEGVQLGGLARRFPSQLSGGQQQRLAIARALAGEPEILLLDEAFNQLDSELEEHLWAWLLEHQCATGMTLLSVTHDVKRATELADRVVGLRNGRLTEIDLGTPRPNEREAQGGRDVPQQIAPRPA